MIRALLTTAINVAAIGTRLGLIMAVTAIGLAVTDPLVHVSEIRPAAHVR